MRRARSMGISKPRRTTAAERLSRRTAGRVTAINTSMGGATATASASARRRASAFGHQLACHNVKVGNEREAEHHSHHMRVNLRMRQLAHPARRESALPAARPASQAPASRASRRAAPREAGHRGCAAEPHRPRPGHPRCQQLLHARVANGDQRELQPRQNKRWPESAWPRRPV